MKFKWGMGENLFGRVLIWALRFFCYFLKSGLGIINITIKYNKGIKMIETYIGMNTINQEYANPKLKLKQFFLK
jgi:hypothetical protein